VSISGTPSPLEVTGFYYYTEWQAFARAQTLSQIKTVQLIIIIIIPSELTPVEPLGKTNRREPLRRPIELTFRSCSAGYGEVPCSLQCHDPTP